MASPDRLNGAALAAAMSMALSCRAKGGSAPKAIEPRSNLEAAGCISQLGQARVSTVSVALNQDDAAPPGPLFPEPSTWKLSCRPDGAVVSDGGGVLANAGPYVQGG